MPNCDAGMTSEVHKCFHEQRRNWSVLPIRRLLIAAVAVCLAVCPATSPILRAAPQQAPSGSNSAPVSGAPVIAANPERVKLSDGNGTTEINWDTGNGSMGLSLSLKKVENRFSSQTVREVERLLHGLKGIVISLNSMETLNGGHCLAL